MLLLAESPSLAEVAEEFAHWRRTRNSPTFEQKLASSDFP